MTYSQFRSRHPEFITAPGSFVQTALDAAEKELDATELGTAFDEAHGLLAAHKLASSPFGTSARLEAGKETTYKKLLTELIAGVVVPLATS